MGGAHTRDVKYSCIYSSAYEPLEILCYYVLYVVAQSECTTVYLRLDAALE